MKRIHLLPNVLTAFGLTCGLFVIFKLSASREGQADMELLLMSIMILLVAGIFDLLDGFVARAMNATSEFGGLFDSLSDAVTFGVAPSVIVLNAVSVEPKTFASFALTTATLLYSVSGVLRLVRFSSTLEQDKSKAFTGLPIPAAASAAVSSVLLMRFLELPVEIIIYSIAPVLIALGYLMVSRLRFPSLKQLNWRVGSFQVVFVVVLVAVLLLYGIVYHFPLVFAAVTWGYVVTALALSGVRYITGRRLQKLAEFDPAPKEED